MEVRSRLQQGNTDGVDVCNCLIIINDVIQRPSYALIGVISHLVTTCAIDTISSISRAETEVLKLRTELDTIAQALEWLPDLTKVKLTIGTTVNTEVLTLVLCVLELVDGVLDVYITSRILDIVTLCIIRNRPGNHTAQSIVVVTSTSRTLSKAIAILLSAVSSVHGHTHCEVRQNLTLKRGIECKALIVLTRHNTLFIQITERAIALELICTTRSTQSMLMSDTSALTCASPVILTHLRVVERRVITAPTLLDVGPRSRHVAVDLIVKIVVWSSVAICT